MKFMYGYYYSGSSSISAHIICLFLFLPSILDYLGGDGDLRRTRRKLPKKDKGDGDKGGGNKGGGKKNQEVPANATISLCVDSCCNAAGLCESITSAEDLDGNCTLTSCTIVADTTTTNSFSNS